MIPKLFWNTAEGRYLRFEELFSTRLAATQNVFDFPGYVEVRDNSPEDINEVVIEMLDRLDGVRTYTHAEEQLQDRYFDLAVKYGSYRGSRIGAEFLARHASLLPAVRSSVETHPMEVARMSA
jgi:hypothetical protein